MTERVKTSTAEPRCSTHPQSEVYRREVGRVDEESDVIGTERKASGRPGDPTRSALKADRWQLGILPQAEKRAGARSGQTGIFSGYLAE